MLVQGVTIREGFLEFQCCFNWDPKKKEWFTRRGRLGTGSSDLSNEECLEGFKMGQ